MDTENRIFGHMPDGTPVEEIVLRDGAVSCRIITYGGALRGLTVPDRAGSPVDVVLGFDTLEDYRLQGKYIGALIGRYANRIGGSRFSLGGQGYPLRANDGPNHLHGGPEGFDKQVWTIEHQTERSLTLGLVSPDGQEGYPGTLSVRVTYTLQGGELRLDYAAQTDRLTLCNLTNHAYFNLSGHQSGPVNGQLIQLFCGRYTPTAAGSIPTGAVARVDGTPMDLRAAQPIGAHADAPFEQLALAGGYDHNWAVDGWDGISLKPAWRLSTSPTPPTGRISPLPPWRPGTNPSAGRSTGSPQPAV